MMGKSPSTISSYLNEQKGDLIMAKCALTTFDNPYNPHTDFNNWFVYDETHGQQRSSHLARIERTSNAMSDEENDAEIERAIDEIIKYDPFGIYTKVYESETAQNKT